MSSLSSKNTTADRRFIRQFSHVTWSDPVRSTVLDNLESAATSCFSSQLVAIFELLVPAHLEIREKAVDSLLERYTMNSKLILPEVVFKVRWCKAMPVDHRILSYLSRHTKQCPMHQKRLSAQSSMCGCAVTAFALNSSLPTTIPSVAGLMTSAPSVKRVISTPKMHV